MMKRRCRSTNNLGHPEPAPPAQEHRYRFPRDDRQVENGVQKRRVDRAPHPAISRKRGVHHQHVPHELVVGAVVRDVVEDDQGIENGHPEYEDYFGCA
jgi:hypothetical protein